MFRRWLQDERGATALEYALVAMVFAVTAITAGKLLGTVTKARWEGVSEAVSQVIGF